MSFHLKAVYTPYAHLSKLSGHVRVLEFLEESGVQLSTHGVPQGSQNFPIQSPIMQKVIQKLISYRGVMSYSLNDLQLEWSLWQNRAAPQPDIIHFFDAEHCPAFLPGLLRRSLKDRCPRLVANVHVPAGDLPRYVNFQVLNQLDHVIAYASDQCTVLQENLSRPEISWIAHGIDSEQFRPARSSRRATKKKQSLSKKSKPRPFRLLTLGRMLRDYECVWQIARLLQDQRHIVFDVISREEPPADLTNVHMHRDISDEDLLAAYQSADALLLPLQGAAANNSILEAAASGLPILTTDLPAIHDYLPGGTCLRVKNNAVNDYATLILELTRDSARCTRLGKAARKQALQFSWPVISRQYKQVYDTLLAQ